MLGGKNKHMPLGYTIVEVMIVLAISGMMFLIAANFINGKQERASFNEGVNTMASRMQGVIDQVASGKYSDADLVCPVGGVTASPQGTNSTCVFLGKLIYFGYDPSNHNSSYATFTLAGLRVDTHGNPFTSPQAAHATVITSPDLTIKQTTPQNLTIHRVTINGTISSFGLGFFQNPGLDSTGNIAQGGAGTIDLYYVPSLAAGQNVIYAENQIQAGTLSRAKSADICLTDGARFADITLGTDNGNPLNVGVKMDGSTPC